MHRIGNLPPHLWFTVTVFSRVRKMSKRKRLTFEEQYELIDEVKSGVPKKSILKKYGIRDATYSSVLARESVLRDKVKNYEYMKKKSSRTSENMVLDAAVLEWYKKLRGRGEPITGPMIRDKALILNRKLKGFATFKASNGWLYRFKQRHGLKINREIKSNQSISQSSDPLGDALEFSDIFQAKIESENLNLDNIYNADETGIFWRLITVSTLAQRLEVEDSGRKEFKDRLTVLFCANSTGSHQISPLTIGKFKNPRCLSQLITEESKDQRLINLESLGVIYTHQDGAWMDKHIFLLWFKEEFIPQVLEHQRTTGITGKVVLLLKDTLSHPSLDELNTINENFEVIYFPPNETALQPMDQGLIATTIELYKTNYLRRLLLSETSEGVTKFLKEFNLRDCFGMLSFAWDDLKSSTVQKAWKPLLGDTFLLKKVGAFDNIQDPLSIINPVKDRESPTDLLSFPDEIFDQVCELLSKLGYSEEKSKEFLLKWFENDHNDNADDRESLSDSDVVNIKTEFVSCDSEIMDEIEKSTDIFENPEPLEITSSEALTNIVKFKNWVKSCAECLPKHLDCIKELENLINESTMSEISENKVYTRL